MYNMHFWSIAGNNHQPQPRYNLAGDVAEHDVSTAAMAI